MDASSGKKNRNIFLFFGSVWVLIIAYNLWSFFGRPDAPSGVQALKSRSVPSAPHDAREVRLAALDRPRQPYRGIVKDIFRPINFAPAPKVVVAPAALPPPPPPKAPTQLETFASEVKFLGFIEKEETKTVFISKGGEVFLVKKGDMIAGAFKVTEITGTAMSIRDEREGQEIKIELAKP